MKVKYITAALCTSLFLTSSAFADNLAVSYDRINREINVSSDVGKKGTVTITVKKSNDIPLGKNNTPDYISVISTDQSGKLITKIKTSQSIKSGKYILYNDSSFLHESAEFMIVNLSDIDTQRVLDEINESLKENNSSKLCSVLSESAEKIGIDLEDEYIKNNIAKISENCYNAGKSKNYTVDSFCNVFECGVAATKITDSEFSVKDVMLKYAPCFGTSYEEYDKIPSDEKLIFDALLKNADWSKASLEDIYLEKRIVAKVKKAQTWSYLKDSLTEFQKEIGLDMSPMSDFAKIGNDNSYKVFRKMFSDIDKFSTYNDIIASFKKSVNDILNTSKSDSSSGGGSSKIGSASKSGGSIPVSGALVDVQNYASKNQFTDTENHWGAEYIKRLSDMKVISGFPDNSFKPDDEITRAEFVKIFVGMFNVKSSEEFRFDDINGDEWYAEYVRIAASRGFVNGFGGNFRPLDKISRQDVAVIISKLEDINTLEGAAISSFDDCNDVSDYAKFAVEKLVGTNIMSGYNNKLLPKEGITRAEVCKILCMAYDKLK